MEPHNETSSVSWLPIIAWTAMIGYIIFFFFKRIVTYDPSKQNQRESRAPEYHQNDKVVPRKDPGRSEQQAIEEQRHKHEQQALEEKHAAELRRREQDQKTADELQRRVQEESEKLKIAKEKSEREEERIRAAAEEVKKQEQYKREEEAKIKEREAKQKLLEEEKRLKEQEEAEQERLRQELRRREEREAEEKREEEVTKETIKQEDERRNNEVEAKASKDADVTSPHKATQENKSSAEELIECPVYLTLFEFKARTERELTIRVGEEVVVIEENAGWLRGKNLESEELGWFPGNYVKKTDKTSLMPKMPASTDDTEGDEVFEEEDETEEDKLKVDTSKVQSKIREAQEKLKSTRQGVFGDE